MRWMFAITFICFTFLSTVPCTAKTVTTGYTNAVFKFAIDYPSGWSAEESLARNGDDSHVTLSVCFSEKGCRPGKPGKRPQIDLEIVDMSGSNIKHAPVKIGAGCEIVESGKRRWAGKRSDIRTVRCPERGHWRYTTTIMMERKRKGMHIDYKLACSMRTKSKDEDESLSEYRKKLEPACTEAIDSSRMMK